MLTQEFIKSILHYEPETGIFTRIGSPYKKCIGTKPSSPSSDGYKRIAIKGKSYRSHRLAWLYVYGYLPKELDHINGIPDDNRICNLRECNHLQNSSNKKKPKNNKSGYKGVYFNKQNKKWGTKITFNKIQYFCGLYSSKEEAASAVRAKREELHGEFTNHG